MGVAKMTTPYQILKNSNLVSERDTVTLVYITIHNSVGLYVPLCNIIYLCDYYYYWLLLVMYNNIFITLRRICISACCHEE